MKQLIFSTQTKYTIGFFIYFLVTAVSIHATAEDRNTTASTSLMATKHVTPVHLKPHRYSVVSSHIYPGAIVSVTKTKKRSHCKKGWYRRANGGYICGIHLKNTSEHKSRPAPRDQADILDGIALYEVTKGGAKVYKRKRHIPQGRHIKRLYRGSMLAVKDSFHKYGGRYFVTREGHFVQGINTKILPAPISKLGIDFEAGQELPLGIIIKDNAKVFLSTDLNSNTARTLDKWSVVYPARQSTGLNADNGVQAVLTSSDEWIKVSDGYILNESIAVFRPQSRPADIEADEQWIAVDLSEQLVHAYVGDQLVKLIPCSTGIKNNTRIGKFKIFLKRRLQSLRLKRGHLRVEDVQYVMYFDKKRAIAIHTAYWHSQFGRPMSHGCVNVPRDDAKWLYNWTTPFSFPEDSENFSSSDIPGTKVVVF